MKNLPEAWREPVAAFLDHKRAEGRSTATIQTMGYRLAALARNTGTAPQHVTTGQLSEAVNMQRAESSQKLLSLYAGVFFAWMKETGRREDNPAECLRPTQSQDAGYMRAMPEAWREPVAAFLDYKAETCATATVHGYGNELCSLARKFDVSPQQVTHTNICEALAKHEAPALRAKTRTACAQFFAWMKETERRRDNPAEDLQSPKAHSEGNVKALPEAWREPVAAFLDYKRAGGCSGETLRTRCYQLAQFAKETGTAPQQVTTEQLVKVLARCEAQWTRKGWRNCFVTFFRWLQSSGLRADNPAALLPNVRSAKPHPKPCPDADIMAALDEAKPVDALMIRLAAECGLRRAEIACIHSRDVITGVHGECSLIVHGKGNKQRTIPVPQDLGGIIKAAKGYLFPGKWTGHVEPSYIGKHVSRLLPEGYSAHKLRHRFATVAYTESHDMLAVSEALGHSSTEVTRHYVALPSESLRKLTDAAALQAVPDTAQTAKPIHQSPAGMEPTKQSEDEPAPSERQPQRTQLGMMFGPEVIRAAMILAAEVGERLYSRGLHSFSIPAETFAERYNVPGMGRGRRADTLLLGALLLQQRGYIELNSAGNDGTISGNVTTGATQLRAAMDEYAQAWLDMQDE